MALPNHRDHVPGPGVKDAVGNGLPPVRDLHIGSPRLLNAAPDVGDNVLRLFVPGIVRGQDTQIRQPSSDFSHRVPPVFGPVSPAPKDTDQPPGLILPQCPKKAFHADPVVGIVHDHRTLSRRVDDLHPPVDIQMLQGVAHPLPGKIKKAAHT